MKVAIIHDYLAQAGGAERVVEALHELFPTSPVYTSVYDPESTFKSFQDVDVRTSFLQVWPFSTRKFHKLALPFYPAAFEQFNLKEYELVISSCSSFSKGILTPVETCHICYCHTPTRFLWRANEYASETNRSQLANKLMSPLLRRLRSWDIESARRVDYFVANSYNVARRIRKYYRREVVSVVYPPVDVDKFTPAPESEIGEHFMIVSRLLSYKRVDLAIDACNALKLQLKVVGAGPDEAELRRRAGPTIQFLGRIGDEQVAYEMARCKALIFPGEEDFGITAVEAMASGRPVIAFGAGGSLETVIDGQTGVFFHDQTVASLSEALNRVSRIAFSQQLLRDHAQNFSAAVFQARMRSLIESVIEDYANNNSIHSIREKSFMMDKPLIGSGIVTGQSDEDRKDTGLRI